MAAASRAGALLRAIAAAATALVFVVLAALFASTVADEIRWSETSMGLGVPRWWFTAAMPPLCLAVAVRAAFAAGGVWRRHRHRAPRRARAAL